MKPTKRRKERVVQKERNSTQVYSTHSLQVKPYFTLLICCSWTHWHHSARHLDAGNSFRVGGLGRRAAGRLSVLLPQAAKMYQWRDGFYASSVRSPGSANVSEEGPTAKEESLRGGWHAAVKHGRAALVRRRQTKRRQDAQEHPPPSSTSD